MIYYSFVVPQISVVGPPVSGKWCVASKISSNVRAPHLSPESILVDAPKELSMEAAKYSSKGEVGL